MQVVKALVTLYHDFGHFALAVPWQFALCLLNRRNQTIPHVPRACTGGEVACDTAPRL
jgi:hypothetical protein